MNVVMFGFNDWYEWQATGFRTRCAQVARRLAVRPEVDRLLVVSTPRCVAVNAVRGLRGVFGRPDPRFARTPYRPKQVAEKIWALDHTRMLPRDESREWTYRANGRMHDSALRAAVRRECAEVPDGTVLWVSDPLMAKHLGTMGESVSVFDAIDDWTRHPQKHAMRRSIEGGYERVRRAADVVFTVSEPLRQWLSEGRDRVFRVPNGVDHERFAVPHDPPADIACLPRPILGYVGIIQERFDVGLLAATALALPDASFVLVGPVVAKDLVAPLMGFPNVHLLGSRPFAEIPAYVSAFDACIVPHVDDPFTRSMDPLKVYEYLAAGKRVVARGVPSLGEPAGLIERPDGRADFIASVRDAVVSAEEGRQQQRRREFAASRSWDSVVDAMLQPVLALRESRAEKSIA